MTKKIILLTTLFLALFVAPARAMEITCNSEKCERNEAKLFEISHFVPGETIKKTLTVNNQSGDDCHLHLKVLDRSQSGDFILADRLLTKIWDSHESYFAQASFTNLFIKRDLGIGTVANNQQKDLWWEVKFDPNAGNEFQGLETKFDFDFNVSCGTSDTNSSPQPQVAGVSTSTTSRRLFNFGAEEEVDLASPSTAAVVDEVSGQVAGASTVCSNWRIFLPWILLVLQVIVIVLVAYYFRKRFQKKELLILLAITFLSILLFYLFRDCQCYARSWLAWLCKYYWVVAMVLTLLIRLILRLLAF